MSTMVLAPSKKENNFLKILRQALKGADKKAYSIYAAGNFEGYLDRFLSSGQMKKVKAFDLLEDCFLKMIEGRFLDIDATLHPLQQGFGNIKKDVYNLHVRGDLLVTYQKEDSSKSVRLFYLGNHANHPSFDM